MTREERRYWRPKSVVSQTLQEGMYELGKELTAIVQGQK